MRSFVIVWEESSNDMGQKMRRIVYNENVYYVDEVSQVDRSWQIWFDVLSVGRIIESVRRCSRVHCGGKLYE